MSAPRPSPSTSFDHSHPLKTRIAPIAGAGSPHLPPGKDVALRGDPDPDRRHRPSRLPRDLGPGRDTVHGPRADRLVTERGRRLRAVPLLGQVRDGVDRVPPGDGFRLGSTRRDAIRRTPFGGSLPFKLTGTHIVEKEPGALRCICPALGSLLRRGIFG